MTIKFFTPHRVIATGLSALLVSACVSNPSSSEFDGVQAKNNTISAYSDLTRSETAETLKRLRAIRKKLASQQTGVYQGPIRHVWDRIRAKPLIQREDNLRTEKQATVLLRNRQYLNRVSRRAAPYVYFILNEIDKRDLPRELVLLPVIESAYRPTAISKSKAVGLWQFIPSTSKFLGMKRNGWYDARRDIITSTKYALDYLENINKMFDGDWLLTLAAYNAGHGTVRRAVARNKKRGLATDYWSLKLPAETMNYVPRFLAASRIFTEPDDYDVTLYAVKNEPHFAVTNIKSQLDLKLAAEMANLSLKEFKKYNPGFLKWSTAPQGPHRLVLPIKSLKRFNKKLANLDYSKRLQMVKYKVNKGETLTGIAIKHGIGVSALKSTNKLQSSLIRTGQLLMVPVKGKAITQAKLPAKTSKRQPAAALNDGFYIVKSGDTLWQIAKRHSITTQTLLTLNNLNEKSVIQPGQRLRIRAHPSVALRL